MIFVLIRIYQNIKNTPIPLPAFLKIYDDDDRGKNIYIYIYNNIYTIFIIVLL